MKYYLNEKKFLNECVRAVFYNKNATLVLAKYTKEFNDLSIYQIYLAKMTNESIAWLAKNLNENAKKGLIQFNYSII